MAEEFNHRGFHRRRGLLKIIGLLLVIAGLFVIANMMAEEAIPLTGWRAVFVGLTLILGGLLALYHGYKLPLAEALELVHRRGRGITASELVHDMRVGRPTADRILAELVRRGFLRHGAERPASATDPVFEPVR